MAVKRGRCSPEAVQLFKRPCAEEASRAFAGFA